MDTPSHHRQQRMKMLVPIVCNGVPTLIFLNLEFGERTFANYYEFQQKRKFFNYWWIYSRSLPILDRFSSLRQPVSTLRLGLRSITQARGIGPFRKTVFPLSQDRLSTTRGSLLLVVSVCLCCLSSVRSLKREKESSCRRHWRT